ncbi:FMN-linked oxidoreductase [Pseudovirgaria hyperparasitica]|uniref:Dihydroorotate dehydrogenase (fumarate) n=1 Tax=Pseudovirgaria hyperparasitica TaxID=470096 RepID=A0A6A6WGQ6_9PEZI|nr:FMN-linked oxidoreductase [Pseudovirgaria hyperparasitica]KAF2762042.1 FMN-linked oxidoreductase [Pseudovirgaria hyperparasitica]
MKIEPPLLNSANPWATTYEDLLALYRCPYTGAVTTRTAMLQGFAHDDAIHRYAFFNPVTQESHQNPEAENLPSEQTASVNNLGYSPLRLSEYLSFIKQISEVAKSDSSLRRDKPFIVSVTGTASDVEVCLERIANTAQQVSMPLFMEVNLSCPNIPNKPPPAYSISALIPYLSAISKSNASVSIPIGLKLPPYTYAGQFDTLITALGSMDPCSISFLTSTNTLGSSMLLCPKSEPSKKDGSYVPVLSPTSDTQSWDHSLPSGLGGLAGSALHPLALGNVFSLQQFLRNHPTLNSIQIIGVGGVEDAEGYKRMRSVGASAVGIGTGLGRLGIGVFEKIVKALED